MTDSQTPFDPLATPDFFPVRIDAQRNSASNSRSSSINGQSSRAVNAG